MLKDVKKKIEGELSGFLNSMDKIFRLRDISPELFRVIKDFVLRDGKRIRPSLFVLGYLGFKSTAAAGLYTSALSLELLHDFMLVHDDIIDKSEIRRGSPSMHAMLNHHLKDFRTIKFSGQDLAIVVGDVMYAMAIHAFLAVQARMDRKETALKRFIEAAVYTGSGEFIELINGLKEIGKVTKKDIYTVYDYKTAYYTFACPLSTGAILAGAGSREEKLLFQYGMTIGRAFQIRDDILGMFQEEQETGKSSLSDLKEGKKTALVWHAYQNASPQEKETIRRILAKKDAGLPELHRMRDVMIRAGTKEFARKEIDSLRKKSEKLLGACRLRKKVEKTLLTYTQNILTV